MEDEQFKKRQYLEGGIDALIVILFELHPLTGHDAEMHASFRKAIYQGWTGQFGLTEEELEQRLDDAIDYDRECRRPNNRHQWQAERCICGLPMEECEDAKQAVVSACICGPTPSSFKGCGVHDPNRER